MQMASPKNYHTQLDSYSHVQSATHDTNQAETRESRAYQTSNDHAAYLHDVRGKTEQGDLQRLKTER